MSRRRLAARRRYETRHSISPFTQEKYCGVPQLLKEKNTLMNVLWKWSRNNCRNFTVWTFSIKYIKLFPFANKAFIILYFKWKIINIIKPNYASHWNRSSKTFMPPFIALYSVCIGWETRTHVAPLSNPNGQYGRKIPHLSSKLLLEICGEKTGKRLNW